MLPFRFRLDRLLTAALVLLLSLPYSVEAATVERLSLDDLTRRAQSIVLGTVIRSETRWSSDGRLILTTHTLAVREALKGQPVATIQLTTVGGRIGDTMLQVAGMPAFEAGETALVFIERIGLYSTVLGLSQGKFTVRGGEVANSVHELQFSDGGPVRNLTMPLDAFRQRVREALERR